MYTRYTVSSAVAGAAAVLAIGVVAGCGSDSATATSDPTSVTAAPTASSPSGPSPSAAPTVAPGSDGGQSSDAPEITVSPGDPGVPPAAQTQAETNFVETLQQSGVTVSQDGATEVNLQKAVCGLVNDPASDPKQLQQLLLAVGGTQQQGQQTSLTPQQYTDLLIKTAQNPANCNR